MQNDKSESSVTVSQRQPGVVVDDIWSTFPNVHLRVLTGEKGSVEIQICDCGMSGQCRPQAWARIERHNRERLAKAIAATPSTEAQKCVECKHAGELINSYCTAIVKRDKVHTVCGHRCIFPAVVQGDDAEKQARDTNDAELWRYYEAIAVQSGFESIPDAITKARAIASKKKLRN